MSDGRLSFSAVQGQEKAKQLWRRIVASDRLAHAYLFRGPDGVGKRLFTRLVAAQMNCRQPTNDGACGVCVSCRKYLSGNHPDFVVVSPDGAAIKIDRIREVCRSLSFPPYESDVRVIVFEDVHTLRTEAANSLLKTLEEPPDQNILILTAESSRVVLPTILSRCQIIPFNALSVEQTMTVLRQQPAGLDDREVAMLASVAGGSPGQAMLLHHEGILDIWREVMTALSPRTLTTADSVTQVLTVAERIAALKQYVPLLLDLLRLWVRNDMVEEGDREDSVCSSIRSARLAAIDRADRRLARNCNRTLVCEVLLFDLQSPVSGVSLPIRLNDLSTPVSAILRP